MSITPTKTWEFAINEVEVAGGSITDRNTRLMLKLFQMLTDDAAVQWVDAANANIAATSPWVLIASSDSSTAGSPGPGWADPTDLVWEAPASNHSWVHLRQVDYFGSGDHLNMLINLGPTVAVHALGYVSFTRGAAGFNADGTIALRPTPAIGATELVVRDGVTTTGDSKTSDEMWGIDSSNLQAVIHMRMSDDGQCGMWWVCIASACVFDAGWSADEENPQTRVNPFWVWASGNDSNSENKTWVTEWNGLSLLRGLDDVDLEINAFVGMVGFTGVESAGNTLNDQTVRWLDQIHIADPVTTSRHGILTDLWWGSDLEGTGDLSPVTPPAVRAQIGDFVTPWPSGAAYQVA